MANAISASHWGIIEYPDDQLSANTLFLQNGEIAAYADDRPAYLIRVNTATNYERPILLGITPYEGTLRS